MSKNIVILDGVNPQYNSKFKIIIKFMEIDMQSNSVSKYSLSLPHVTIIESTLDI